MSNHTSAEAAAHDLNGVSMDDVGHVAVVGFQGVIFALLDVADAIREQTAAEYERQAIIPHEASSA